MKIFSNQKPQEGVFLIYNAVICLLEINIAQGINLFIIKK